MFIVFKCHTRSLICILYSGIYWRVFQRVHTHFPNTSHSFVKSSQISQRSALRWSCGVDNPQGQTHSIETRSLALSLCCFLSSSLAMRAANSSSSTQIFTACPELRCLLLPYQLPLDFGAKLDTSNHSRRSMIFMSKQKGFFLCLFWLEFKLFQDGLWFLHLFTYQIPRGRGRFAWCLSQPSPDATWTLCALS